MTLRRLDVPCLSNQQAILNHHLEGLARIGHTPARKVPRRACRETRIGTYRGD